MKREKARKAAEVMLAYANGENIEVKVFNGDTWIGDDSPSFNWVDFRFRIKPKQPKPKYRPFKDAEECWQEMQKHEPFGWLKLKNEEYGNYTICFVINGYCDLTYAFDNYAFADGSVFGVKEE